MTDAVVTEQINRSRSTTTAMPPISNGGGGRRRGGLGWVLLLLAVIAVAVLGVLVGKSVLGTKAEKVAVPSVVGLAQADAESRLDARGLKAVTTFENDPNVTEGNVIKQVPDGGATASRGDQVALTVSQGEVRATVPDVVGSLLPDARKALQAANLVPNKVTRENSDRPNNEVLSTNPKAGTKRELNSRVDLVVSNGVPLVEVPNVVGLPYAQAYATITQAGFLVPSPSQQVSDRYPPGYVLQQVPPGGGRADRGSIVTFVLTAAGNDPGVTPTPTPAPTLPGAPTPTPVVTPVPPAISSRPAGE
jgi:serine/threonine-protein kinase